MSTPDYERAATKAMETIIKYDITTAPVIPLPIFKHMPGVLVLTYAEVSNLSGLNRKDLVRLCGEENQDAVTAVQSDGSGLKYIVTYNQRLPIYMVQRSLARELGHIILGHDGSRPDDVRTAEALCFAYHLLCPRPLIYAVQQAGIRLSVEVLGNMTGCYERCLIGMRKTPGVKIPIEMNRQVKQHFKEYLVNFLSYQSILAATDDTPIADFGTYMDYYEE